jgi:hypothetical protein
MNCTSTAISDYLFTYLFDILDYFGPIRIQADTKEPRIERFRTACEVNKENPQFPYPLTSDLYT